MRKPPSQAQMQKAVDAFNGKIIVGEDVAVTLDDGTVTFDKTTSTAQILTGHTPVVMLQGKGMYLLERVRKIRKIA